MKCSKVLYHKKSFFILQNESYIRFTKFEQTFVVDTNMENGWFILVVEMCKEIGWVELYWFAYEVPVKKIVCFLADLKWQFFVHQAIKNR